MKSIVLLFLLIIVANITSGCFKTESKEQEVAALENDSIITEITEAIIKDTMLKEVASKDIKVKEAAMKDIERVKEELDNSEYSEIPCQRIIDEIKGAVNDYCNGKISEDILSEKLAIMDDIKVKICFNDKFAKVRDEIDDQLAKCLESKK